MPQPRRRKKQQPQVVKRATIILDRERDLVFSMYGLGKLEEILEQETGEKINVFDGFGGIEINARNAAKLIWSALLQDDEEFDTDDPYVGIKKVAKLLNTENMAQALNAIDAAIEVSYPDPDPDAQGSDPLPAKSR